MIPLDFAKLQSLELVAAHLQTTPHQLWSFVSEPEKYYTRLTLAPRRGRTPRTVFEVAAPLRRLHRTLAVALEPQVSKLASHVQGFRRKRNGRVIGIYSNAKRHTHSDLVVTADIRAFFDNIRLGSVIDLFERVGAPHQSALLLARLSTYNSRLPQGGRASPTISNLAVRDLDRTLLRVAGKAKYSRYVDDLTFSGDDGACPTEAQLQLALEAHGFELRPKSYKRQFKKSGQLVTGLSLYNDHPTLTRQKRRSIERVLHFGALYGLTSHLAMTHSNNSPQEELARLEGRINAVGAVDQRLRRRWLKLLNNVRLS